MAVTMADYVSRDTAPEGAELATLGAFLHEHELGVPADLAYVITALHQPAGDPLPEVEVLWSDDSIRIGDATTTEELARGCARHVTSADTADLPDDFAMDAGAVLVIAEACARLTREGSLTGRFVAGDIYRLHAAPVRDPGNPPSAPAYSLAAPRGAPGPLEHPLHPPPSPAFERRARRHVMKSNKYDEAHPRSRRRRPRRRRPPPVRTVTGARAMAERVRPVSAASTSRPRPRRRPPGRHHRGRPSERRSSRSRTKCPPHRGRAGRPSSPPRPSLRVGPPTIERGNVNPVAGRRGG